jgi:hypothetical protein
MKPVNFTKNQKVYLKINLKNYLIIYQVNLKMKLKQIFKKV